MPNSYAFSEQLPVAPLKIAALKGCMELAAKVNEHIVAFRKNDMEELEKRVCTTEVMKGRATFLTLNAQDLELERESASLMNLCAVRIFL